MVDLGMAWPISSCLDMRLPNQIEKGEKEDPDQVDQGPVEGGHFDGGEIGAAELDLGGPDQGEGHQAHADEDVQPVQTGHDEVEAEEDVHEGIMEPFAM